MLTLDLEKTQKNLENNIWLNRRPLLQMCSQKKIV